MQGILEGMLEQPNVRWLELHNVDVLGISNINKLYCTLLVDINENKNNQDWI